MSNNNFFTVEEFYGVNHCPSQHDCVEDFREVENIDSDVSVFNEKEAIGMALTILDKTNIPVLMTYENVQLGVIEKTVIYSSMKDAVKGIAKHFKEFALSDGMPEAEINKIITELFYTEYNRLQQWRKSNPSEEIWNLGYGFRLHEISVEI